MALAFYPHPDDTQKGSLTERLEVLSDAAERFRAVILDMAKESGTDNGKKRMTPKDQTAAYNWEEIARILREIRDLPEGGKHERERKADLMTKLAEIYEVLRAAKMSKLEAVRLALISEATQLKGSSEVA